MAGKGDRYRPVDRQKYAENYDRIFGKRGPIEEVQQVSPEVPGDPVPFTTGTEETPHDLSDVRTPTES